MERPVEISDHNSIMETSFFGMVITTLLKFQAFHDELEEKVKGTAAEGTIKELFQGHYYLHHTNFKSVSSVRKEVFSSLELDVENCRDLYSSLDKYLEEKNRYHVSFTEFPQILLLQLERFAHNDSQETKIKVNSRYEYPYQLDLDRENGKYLSTDADRSIRRLYTLHSVIVHSGGVQDGKYFAIIRPTLSDVWLKLEDEVVSVVDVKRALNEQYGGDTQHPPFKFKKGRNAFMFVYIRESNKDSIMCSIDEKDITEQHIGEGKDDKEVAAANRFVIIKVTRDEDLPDMGCSFKVDKHVSFRQFEDEVAEYFGVDRHRLRFYKSQALSSLVWLRNLSDTVEKMVGDSDQVTLYLKFDTNSGITGHPDVLDFARSDSEPARVTKSSANVRKP